MATKPSINTKWAQTKYNLTYAPGRSHKYIVDHYTGTDACAENNCKYFGGGNRNASADFFIDKNGTIWQFNANLNKYYSWHCGDGYGRYGITNANSIGIEVVSAGAKFTEAQQESLRKLHLWLMDKYDIPASNVVRHYDASRKLCPKPYCGTTAKNKLWKTLRAKTTSSANVETNAVKVSATAADNAKSYLKALAGTYKCTDDLNLRQGAGVKKALKVEMPKGTNVKCYGYYTANGATKWLLVQATVDGKEYVGFCSKAYLKKI